MSSINVSVRTAALLALSQDICALISLTIESILSTINYIYRFILYLFGLGNGVTLNKERQNRRESGKGCGIVILGADQAAGQSLTLHLAKIGYTVFPLIPLPSPSSPSHTSSALTHLLLTWSSIQKRLRSKFPGHSGNVVPVMIDPEYNLDDKRLDNEEEGGEGRFQHAGETVRAYCKENELTLVSIICTSGKLKTPSMTVNDTANFNLHQAPFRRSKNVNGKSSRMTGDVSPTSMQRSLSAPSCSSPGHDDNPPARSSDSTGHEMNLIDETTSITKVNPPSKSAGTIKKPPVIPQPSLPIHALTLSEQPTLLSLYRSNILDPLSIIKELHDLLSISNTKNLPRGRIVFVNGENNGKIVELNNYDNGIDTMYYGYEKNKRAFEFIDTVRKEMISLVKDEMSGVGVDVCQVIVGPMSPRIGTAGYHLRRSSEDSNEGASAILDDTLQSTKYNFPSILFSSPGTVKKSREIAVSVKLNLIKRFWAVDDALLFSSVRRAIEDPYARSYHRAGLSPIIQELIGIVPFNLGFKCQTIIVEMVKIVLEVQWTLNEWWRGFLGDSNDEYPLKK
ncbi:uncharacterized protein L201_002978 [Kwoniella dendrophila CBS 6074]|uniref:Uncharacterized protein n=1 Tax=Kwoniella dendrophila CBS 6074 TaxID=1295534 RepID=A0AAX4JTE8_9TREE